MNKKLRGIICLLVFVMLAAGCSQTSNFGSSVQQFFGFNRPTHTPMPVSTATAVPNEQKAQNAVQPDADPFGSSKSGGGLADLDWDDFDPALIEPDTPETETKTEAKTTPVEEEDYDLVVTNWTNTVEAGAEASVTIQGKPNTEYSISVFYHSGPSKAEGLKSKTSDGNGNVTWTWKVGTKTDKDTYDITVSGGGKHEKIQFTVV